MKKPVFPIFLTLCFVATSFAQTFINLNFEQATVDPIDPDGIFLDWGLAAPGWEHSDGFDTGFLYHNTSHAGVTQAYTLLSSPTPSNWPDPLEGDYSLLFRNGSYSTSSGGPGWVHAFVAQTALIPADALSVRLLADGPLSVYINDVEIPMVSLGGMTFGGDISLYADTVSELRIQNSAPSPIVPQSDLVIDAIQFSSQAIPEPMSGVLLFGGALLLWFLSERKRWVRKVS